MSFGTQMNLMVLRICWQVEDIDCDVLLGNMEDVHQTSKQLIAEMEENREQLGKVFASTSKSLLVVYTVYCKNHNVATVTLKRVSLCGEKHTCVCFVFV